VNDGLRTLLVAKTEIPEDVYGRWSARYQAASTAMSGRDEQMAELMEEIEVELVLQGSTAIEDKLQGAHRVCAV
jgi:magnesium-transporting ATPase (P-type)